MTEHVPECELLEPCSEDIPEHGYPLSIYCIHCERTCICDALRACEQRVLDAAVQRVAAVISDIREISHD